MSSQPISLSRSAVYSIYVPNGQNSLFPLSEKGAITLVTSSWPKSKKDWDEGVGASCEAGDGASASSIRNFAFGAWKEATAKIPAGHRRNIFVSSFSVYSFTDISDNLRILSSPTVLSAAHCELSPADPAHAKKKSTAHMLQQVRMLHTWSACKVSEKGGIFVEEGVFRSGRRSGTDWKEIGKMETEEEDENDEETVAEGPLAALELGKGSEGNEKGVGASGSN